MGKSYKTDSQRRNKCSGTGTVPKKKKKKKKEK